MTELLQHPWTVVGWMLFVLVLAFGVAGFVFMARRRRLLAGQFETENRLLEERIQLVREKRKYEEECSEAWNGFANFVVARKVRHGDSGVCSFYLKPRDERLSLAPFQPGQHLVFQFPVAGKPITRRYSLSDSPGKGYYRISVKQLPSPDDRPEVPPGIGSTYLHQEIEEEASSPYKCLIQVACPAGSFVLEPKDSQPVVLIGGGIGITPMLSMFNSILAENESREVHLFYGVRDAEACVIFDEDMLPPDFESILSTRQNVHLNLYYSEAEKPEDLPKQGPDGAGRHCGRITVDRLKEHLSSNNYRFYICGPERMMNQIEEDLEAWGVPKGDILSERFAPPAAKRPLAGFVSRKIRFAKSGKEAQFDAGDANILEVAEKAGVPISFDCRAGSCGTCKIGVISGKVTETIRTNYKCAPGSCLTCSCLPETDIVLDC